MKVLQFAFDSDAGCGDLPHNYTTSHCVVYTGTHDNMTLRGWTESLGAKAVTYAKQYTRVRERKDLPEEIVRLAWSSVGELAVAQMQDFLDAPASARMNTPATPSGNWQYRTQRGDFTAKCAKKIYRLNAQYNRLPVEA
jgi:4-alpha-glucanotransferase